MSAPTPSLPSTATFCRSQVSYPRFLLYSLRAATDGSLGFYAWMTLLTAIMLVGANAWAHQVAEGLHITGMGDHVSWGLYIANFTFMVGVAAAAVMMVIPAYLYHDRDMHDAVIIGELLSIAAIVMCLLFVVVDMGRPDRFWHLIPGIGRFNWPMSMLTWDVIVLNGYLLLNLHICGYLIYMRFRGETPNPRWYVPFVFLAILWAISIHTVTAFLYCGLGGRPFWNSAVLAPRFLASAFVAGPAFIIVALQIIRALTQYAIGEKAIVLLVKIVRITCIINLFLLVCEIFTILYTGSSHVASLTYLMKGLHGKTALVKWFSTAIGMNVLACLIFLCPATIRHHGLLNTACVLTFTGIWIEKGMGLIIPGFVPSTLGEVVEYVPTLAEWKIMAGIWAFGLMVFTILLKIAIPVFTQITEEKPADSSRDPSRAARSAGS